MRARLDPLWLPRSGVHVTGITFAAATVAAAVVVRSWPILAARPQPYPDIIAGTITWTDYPKSSEYLAIACFFLTFLLAWPLLTVAANRIPRPVWPSTGDTSGSVPSGLIIGLAAYAGTLGLVTRTWPWTAIAAVLLLLGARTALNRTPSGSEAPRSSAAPPVFVATVVSVVCSYFSIVAVLAALDALRPDLFPGREAVAGWTAVLLPLVGGAVLLAVHRRIPPRGWQRIVSGSQIVLPLLITVLAHDAYRHGPTLIRMNIPTATRWGIALTAVTSLWLNVAAWRRAAPWTTIPPADRLIRPVSVVWIASFLMYQVPEPSGLAWDYFHLGEFLLPWHQTVVHHRWLFTEFVPVQGGMSLLYGAVNALLLGGTVSSFPIAVSWLSVGAAAATAWLVCRLTGPAWGLVLAPFFPIGFITLMASYNRVFLVLPIMAALAHPGLLAHPRRWLGAWAALSVLHLLYNAIIGLACAAAGVPVAVWMAGRARTGSAIAAGRRRRLPASIGLGLAVGLAALAPFLSGQIRFLVENGPANTAAYGMGVLQVNGVPDWFWWPDNKLAWELVRSGGWIGVVLLLWAILLYEAVRRRRGERSNPAGIVIAVTGLLFLLGLTPYSMGQIRPDELSRPGMASLLAVGGLAPLALVLALGADRRRALLVAGLVGALLGARGAFSDHDPWRLAQRVVAPIEASENAALHSGADLRLPNLGNVFIQPDTLRAIQRFQAALGRLLREHETYLDLTNRSGLYFILDRPVPVPYPADYTAPNAALQDRIILALERDPPPLAWVGPRVSFNGAPASLRTYRVYRWLIERGYRFADVEGYAFLVRPDRSDELRLGTDEGSHRDGLRRMFSPPDLGLLPLAWGRTLDGSGPRFQPHAVSLVPAAPEPAVAGNDPMRVWGVDSPLRGADADFVAVRVACGRALSRPIAAHVFWASGTQAFSTERSLAFGLAAGELLIPVGSHPDWLTSDGITRFGVRLAADAGPRCGVLRIDPPRFLRLVG